MFKTGDYVVYKRDVCVIKEIKKNYFHNQDYFCLKILKIRKSQSIKIVLYYRNYFIYPLPLI